MIAAVVVPDADAARRRSVHARIARVEANCGRTLHLLDLYIQGAKLNRDADLVKYVLSLRRKIIDKKGRWLPKYIFRERPPHLFWVEGTSKAVFTNYIPETDADVYLVATCDVAVNLDILRNKLLFDKRMPNRVRYVCVNAVICESDLVHTIDPQKAEQHAEKIRVFAQFKDTRNDRSSSVLML